ncbi:hypothetical protein OQJ26_06155 [Legionella sp. PATHC038]|uniref:hypothetical protein n=1 Tax=Legionella sheltonii TaxID=2992041 RepID=UPI0022435B99|nr:hypothetical protein [Legionella sp. PATHC038]MCW8398371.1 hypothetical protein [Legionella sp. PATHC038]
MKVGEFKKQVIELGSNIDPLKTPAEVLALISKLSELFEPLNDQFDLDSDMMIPVKELTNQFWNLVIRNIPCEQSAQWNTAAYVMPWLTLQQSLVKVGLMNADFHHPVLYEELKNHFNRLSVTNDSLKITELMPLFIRASRMLGYAEVSQLEHYPFLKLNEKITANRRQEIEKLEDIMFLLRSVFYLMYRHCTSKQLALIPSLIYFRYHTTDEERRSELAIFNWLTQHTLECTQFFSSHDDYINMRSIKEIDALHNAAHLLPKERKNFLNATNENRWIYPFIHQSRGGPAFLEEKDASVKETLRLLNQDFNCQKDKSFTGIWRFAFLVKMQARILSPNEAKIVHAATYAFCMEKYIEQFNFSDDSKNSFSVHSEWESLKCQAAEKRKLAAINGKSVKLGFFETLAVSQGRLKKLINFLEENQTPDSEEFSSSLETPSMGH